MFTGLVETTARLGGLRRQGPHGRLDLRVELEGVVELGESISVSGACLTVAKLRADGFEADVSSETLERTTLGALRPGDRVNVERASKLGARMGGHIVTGHVDGVGRVAGFDSGPEARRLLVHAPAEVQRFLAAKGSVTVDGVSLTVNQLCDDGQPDRQGFEVMLVPHTLGHTTLVDLAVGRRVNLEVDILARYVVRQLELAARATSSPLASASPQRVRAEQPSAAEQDEAILRKLREGGFF